MGTPAGCNQAATLTSRIPFRVDPMLATLVAAPFDKSGWAYEEKYDGDRILAYKEGDRVRLLSRNGKDRTDRFPEIAAAIRALAADTLLLDGEVVVFDQQGVSRTTRWLKVKVHQEDEFVICGYTKPTGSWKHFGALLLGAYESGRLHYVGKVGTGFDDRTLAAVHQKLQPLVSVHPPVVDPPRQKGVVFVAPQLIAQISFQEWTADKKLRQPVFLGLRDDKRPEEVLLPGQAS
jgi:ATP-dependent DNA ligase